jgi:hypothetical protein
MSVQEVETIQEVEAVQEVESVQESTPVAPNILRTRRDGVWEVYDGVWGSYIRPTDDPDANVVIDEDNLNQFELKENIHRIPAELWAKWVKLCYHFVDKVNSSVEVSIRILRNQDDPSEYRFLVPMQQVSGASVRVETFDTAVDLATGEEITQYPPDGWIPVGSSHSHNTMQAFFSGVDDKYELDDPGIHLVIGSIDTKTMKYAIAASVVGSHRRFIVEYDKLVDAIPINNAEFHEKVLDYVDTSPPKVKVFTAATSTVVPTKWTKKVSKIDDSLAEQWNDPNTWGYGWDYDRKGYGWDYDTNDHNDPFYWHGDSTSSTSSTGDTLKLWSVIDIANDYAKQNANDPNRLHNLREELMDFICDLDAVLGTSVCS